MNSNPGLVQKAGKQNIKKSDTELVQLSAVDTSVATRSQNKITPMKIVDTTMTPVRIDSTPTKPPKASSHQKPTNRDSPKKAVAKIERKSTTPEKKKKAKPYWKQSESQNEDSDFSEEVIERRRSSRLTRNTRTNVAEKEDKFREELQKLQTLRTSKRRAVVKETSANPLDMGNVKEAQTEIVRQTEPDLAVANQKEAHSDDDEEVQIQKQLQLEKEQLDANQEEIEKFYTEDQLRDMQLLFGMSQEEITEIKQRQEAKMLKFQEDQLQFEIQKQKQIQEIEQKKLDKIKAKQAEEEAARKAEEALIEKELEIIELEVNNTVAEPPQSDLKKELPQEKHSQQAS